MERENIDIKDYWPLVIKIILEFEKIADAENPGINNLWAAHKDVLDNQSNLIIDLSLLWNQYLILEPFTHEELEECLHRELREEDLNPANYNKYLTLKPLTYQELTAYDHKNLRKGNLTNG